MNFSVLFRVIRCPTCRMSEREKIFMDGAFDLEKFVLRSARFLPKPSPELLCVIWPVLADRGLH